MLSHKKIFPPAAAPREESSIGTLSDCPNKHGELLLGHLPNRKPATVFPFLTIEPVAQTDPPDHAALTVLGWPKPDL